jgi:histidinol-phosphate aminotransferase
MTFDLDALVRAELDELSAYAPEAGDFEVRLDANEAPPLLSVDARRRLAEALVPDDFCRYPDARQVRLRRAIAAATGVDERRVIAGCGTDEIIALLLDVLCRPRGKNPAATIVTQSPTFSMYRHGARARGMRVLEVPLDDQWDLALDSMKAAMGVARPNLVFVSSPNNPTSRLMSLDRLEALVDATEGALCVIDEAYVAYSPRDQLALLDRGDHVAILRTLSKVGFAALRVGWLIGAPALVEALDKMRQPFNLSVAAQRAAAFILSELADDVRAVRDAILDERAWLEAGLARLGLECTPSDANFLWVKTPGPAGEVYEGLRSRGILVRTFHDRGGRLRDRLRITVGTRADHERLLSALGELP